MFERVAGLLVFLPIPFVLYLYTNNPGGVTLSMGVGLVLMVTHVFYARPFARWRASRRCLWSGARIDEGVPVTVRDPLGAIDWHARDQRAADRLERTFGWAQRNSNFLRIGVLGTLITFLIAHPFAATDKLQPIQGQDTISFFRLGIALTVLPLGWLGPRSRRSEERPLRFPSPLHIQALIGTGTMVWLLRIVGAVWLVQASLHFLRRLGG